MTAKVRDLRRRLGSLRPRPVETTYRQLGQLTSDELRRELCALAGVENGDIVGACEASARDLATAGLADEGAEFQKIADELRAADLAAASRRFVDPLRAGNDPGPDDESGPG
jgi:hypothetical protein